MKYIYLVLSLLLFFISCEGEDNFLGVWYLNRDIENNKIEITKTNKEYLIYINDNVLIAKKEGNILNIESEGKIIKAILSEKKDLIIDGEIATRTNPFIKPENSVFDSQTVEVENNPLSNAVEEEQPRTISELYPIVKSGVFLIYTKNNYSTSQGTGFFLNKHGIAISCYHVFNSASEGIIYLDNGKECVIGETLDYNKELDYIIFRVYDPSDPAYQFHPLNLSNQLPEIGSNCFTIGNPYGLTQTLSIGNISGFRENNNLIQTTTEISFGSSGGPLFNEKGEVVGVTSSGMGDANLNFAININSIPYRNFLLDEESSYPNRNSNINNQIIDLIKHYYFLTENNSYDELYKLYTPKLERFYGEFNKPASQVITSAKNRKQKSGVQSSKKEIYWNTLKITPLHDNTYYATFEMDYFLNRKDKDKPNKFKLKIIMKITDSLKIQSIYEDILFKS